MPSLCHVPSRYASVPRRDRRGGRWKIVYHRDPHMPPKAAIWHADCKPFAQDYPGKFMPLLPYLADVAQFHDAAELIARFGDDAGFEAAARADQSRDIGNTINFCRWRQIERLIILLSVDGAVGTVH